MTLKAHPCDVAKTFNSSTAVARERRVFGDAAAGVDSLLVVSQPNEDSKSTVGGGCKKRGATKAADEAVAVVVVAADFVAAVEEKEREVAASQVDGLLDGCRVTDADPTTEAVPLREETFDATAAQSFGYDKHDSSDALGCATAAVAWRCDARRLQSSPPPPSPARHWQRHRPSAAEATAAAAAPQSMWRSH